MASLFDPSNRLAVDFKVLSPSGSVLVDFPIEFSESVPNQEQADLLAKLFAFGESVTVANGANDVAGSVFNSANSAEVSFSVLASDGTVLEHVAPKFGAEVPNAEAAVIFSQLAAFAAGVVADHA